MRGLLPGAGGGGELAILMLGHAVALEKEKVFFLRHAVDCAYPLIGACEMVSCFLTVDKPSSLSTVLRHVRGIGWNLSLRHHGTAVVFRRDPDLGASLGNPFLLQCN